MLENQITFQIPTDFLSRISLKLEWLFKMASEACVQSHPTIHRYALKNLIEIMEIIDKPELKGRYLKELVRLEHVLTRQQDRSNTTMMDQLSTQIHALTHLPGSFIEHLSTQPFLKSIRQIHLPSSQECEHNSPQLIMWLDRSAIQRQQELKQWLNLLQELEQTVAIYLTILRQSATYEATDAHHGFYHHPLPQITSSHLIQLRMDKTLNFVPKFQLSHHGLTIRLHKLHAPDEILLSTVSMEIAVSEI